MLEILPYNKAIHEAGRKDFQSNAPALDHYFKTQLSQDIKNRVASCFVATDDSGTIIGFYTLSATGVPLTGLPEAIARKLPRYPLVPAARMGRLAVDQRFQSQGFGGVLLADAILRVAKSEIASFALIVDAKDEIAAAFYEHYGFIPLLSQPLTYFLPLSRLRDL